QASAAMQATAERWRSGPGAAISEPAVARATQALLNDVREAHHETWAGLLPGGQLGAADRQDTERRWTDQLAPLLASAADRFLQESTLERSLAAAAASFDRLGSSHTLPDGASARLAAAFRREW